MSNKRVNLDAMILRLDLSTMAKGTISASSDTGIPVSELARNRLHFRLLRKPDFQRVTNEWDIDNVVRLIKSFRDADLIPALIMWHSDPGFHFVIDGAHRLSALIAWVNNDYGDKAISENFFDGKISKHQKDIAQQCRDRVAVEVGTYNDLSKALDDESPSPQRLRWASNISKSLVTQWVGGDAETAEKSFITINSRAIQINDTELLMIRTRRKPNVIAARALIRAATGHEYWSAFDAENKDAIRKRATQVYDILFEPETADAARSIEMPIAGKSYSANALRMALEVVNISTGIKSRQDLEESGDDNDGSKTVRALDKTYGNVKYIAGDQLSSLGLHPSVYFWGATGNHQPSAFLAIISFLQYLSQDKARLFEFCSHRADFEEFLVVEEGLIKFILGKFGGWTKSVPAVLEMYKIIMSGLAEGHEAGQIRKSILQNPRFQGLSEMMELSGYPNKKIARGTKIAVARRELLANAVRCGICHSRLPSSAFSDDHMVRVQDGGRGSEDNIQLTHPFCNSGFKEYLISSQLPFPSPPAFLSATS